MINKEADIVYGSRYLKQDNRRILYFWHTFMNKGLTLLTNMYTNLDITDMETCYKLFKKEVVSKPYCAMETRLINRGSLC